MKILIADDHRLMREGLRAMLEKEPSRIVVAEASNGRDAVRFAEEQCPDLVIMDIGMPDLNGIDATRQIVAALPGVKVIGLSMHSDKRFVAEMLKAGAVGYILKDCAFDELERAVRAAQYNQIYLSPSISGVLVQDYMRGSAPADASPASKLSEREREVLQLLAEGKVSREIAEHLNLSVKTVETHRKHIMDKLEIYTVSELTKFAIREGLTSLDR